MSFYSKNKDMHGNLFRNSLSMCQWVSDGSCAAGVPERSEGMKRKRNSGRSAPNKVRGTSIYIKICYKSGDVSAVDDATTQLCRIFSKEV